LGSNSFDLTALVSAAVANGESWLGLHMQNLGGGKNLQWTSANRSGNADAAAVRLNVEFAPVPLPAGLPLALAGVGAFAALRSRRQRSCSWPSRPRVPSDFRPQMSAAG
jgi:hypothetical protein